MVKILVGHEEAVFHINIGLLHKSTFLAQHGLPKARPSTAPPDVIAEREPSTPPSETSIFVDDASQFTVGSDDERAIDLTHDDADYELKGQFYYTRDAFEIFLRHLHDALPVVPTNQNQCRSLLRAYALAARYEVCELQNHIIDVLQKYYLQYSIPITDLIFVIESWTSNAETRLVSYLIEQAAYEMASNWEKYQKDNGELEVLFAGDHKRIVKCLFQAAMQHAKPNSSADPAKDKRNYRHG